MFHLPIILINTLQQIISMFVHLNSKSDFIARHVRYSIRCISTYRPMVPNLVTHSRIKNCTKLLRNRWVYCCYLFIYCTRYAPQRWQVGVTPRKATYDHVSGLCASHRGDRSGFPHAERHAVMHFLFWLIPETLLHLTARCSNNLFDYLQYLLVRTLLGLGQPDRYQVRYHYQQRSSQVIPRFYSNIKT